MPKLLILQDWIGISYSCKKHFKGSKFWNVIGKTNKQSDKQCLICVYKEKKHDRREERRQNNTG